MAAGNSIPDCSGDREADSQFWAAPMHRRGLPLLEAWHWLLTWSVSSRLARGSCTARLMPDQRAPLDPSVR